MLTIKQIFQYKVIGDNYIFFTHETEQI